MRLLDAGLDLIGTQGWGATTVRGVCAHAKLTSRFFYESFDDIDALGLAVFDEVVEETTASVFEAVRASRPEPAAQARAAIDTFVRILTDDPRKARVSFMEALGNEALTQRRVALMGAFAKLIAASGRKSLRPSSSEEAFVELTARLLVGGFAELLNTWLRGGIAMDREQLIDDCVALFVAVAESAAEIARQRSGTD